MRQQLSKMKEITILIDFSNQVWRNHHGTLKKMIPNSDGVHTGSIVGLCKTLMQAINQVKNYSDYMPKLVICEDRSPTRKRELYYNNQEAFIDYSPDKTYEMEELTDTNLKIRYKGNRIKEPMDYNPVEICREFMSCINHTTIYCDGEEADDVLASYIYKHPKEKIILYSTDKDMWQLLDKFDNLEIMLDGEGNYPDDNRMLKAFDTLDKDKILLHKMIRGDSGDNVKGVKRFPFKKHIEAFKECDGDFEDWFSIMIDMYGKDSNVVKLILKYMDLIILNYKVVKLRTDLEYVEEHHNEMDSDKWNDLCDAFETPSLVDMSFTQIF